MKTYPENNNTARVFCQISESVDIQQQSSVNFQKIWRYVQPYGSKHPNNPTYLMSRVGL